MIIAEIKAGWLDLVVLKHSAAVNCYTSINLTKLDVLDTFSTIRVAVAYCISAGEKLTSLPADLSLLDNCRVDYVDLPGWQSSTKGVPIWSDLPLQAQRYIEFIETSVGVKIGYIGTGPDREDKIILFTGLYYVVYVQRELAGRRLRLPGIPVKRMSLSKRICIYVRLDLHYIHLSYQRLQQAKSALLPSARIVLLHLSSIYQDLEFRHLPHRHRDWSRQLFVGIR